MVTSVTIEAKQREEFEMKTKRIPMSVLAALSLVVRGIMRKMGARSFADLVCMAMKLQILEQDLGETENIGVFDGGAYPRRELAAAQLSRRVCE